MNQILKLCLAQIYNFKIKNLITTSLKKIIEKGYSVLYLTMHESLLSDDST